ncbi:serine hydroxymethyltransferase [Buchnera aphidicola (Anoecia oenotherae)]|uniref:Serine hydroxymethyltransferase n=1 Tax=Buchnera aphidicola (Anoecia oenotherae) TaxID=1241833 RepID=A0A4D6XQ66_9GAMM|nr:serine hydroxymethyltransferase [Buchnera aphidicola (Anoecia oenotherae)]
MITSKLKINDFDLWKIIEQEKIRQEEHIELIASENYASVSVMQAQGSCLTNKYAEGYPHKRYYGGCENVDKIELLAIQRAKELFDADYANVQPHSGSQANFAVYSTLLKSGDLILGLALSHGGHLTHGSKVNFSGKIFNSIEYGVNDAGFIDYSKLEKIAINYRPKMIIGGFSAYSRICDWERMRFIADKISAYFIVDIAHIAGLVAAKLYPNPIHYAHVVTSTTHKTLGGPRGGLILSKNQTKSFYHAIDMSVFPGSQGGPLMHVIAAKAIAFKEAMTPNFLLYQKQILINAQYMSEIFIQNNFNIVSNGTENHLFLIDLSAKKITGKEAEYCLGCANIIVNKNSVPNDTKSPLISSGIRIGTAAITRRGFKEKESKLVSYWMIKIINNINNKNKIDEIKQKVRKLCLLFPVYDYTT